MKKTLITLMALAGVAVAGEALTLPGSDDFTWIAGSNANGIGTGASSAEIVQNLASAITATTIGNTDLVGWFGGTGQAYSSGDYGSDISITSSTSSFKFTCRPALSGEYVALGLTKAFTASSITLTFTTDNKLGYSLWSYDGTTATELIANTYVDAAKDVSVTYDAALVKPSQLFVVWTANPSGGNAGGGTAVNVSNIGVSYVPEPATATLSLLALAGLAARRRRK